MCIRDSNKGYYIKETEDETFYTVCVNGKWSPKIPICKSKLQFNLKFLIKCVMKVV